MPTAPSRRRLVSDGSFAVGSISSLVSTSDCRVAEDVAAVVGRPATGTAGVGADPAAAADAAAGFFARAAIPSLVPESGGPGQLARRPRCVGLGAGEVNPHHARGSLIDEPGLSGFPGDRF